MKLLTSFESHFSNSLQRLYSGNLTLILHRYWKPHVVLKIVPEAGYDAYRYTGENRPIAKNQRQKSTNGREENFDATSGTIFRISVFRVASRNFPFIFLCKKAA
jgi:hypothetical protein